MTGRKIVPEIVFLIRKQRRARHTREFFTRNAGYNSWNNWGTWALASKSSSHRLFDSWSSIQSSVCTLHYAICRFSILSFPFSPTSFLFHSRHRRNSLFIINFLIPWTFTQFPFSCLRVPVFQMFSASVVFTFWIYFSFASFNIFFPIIPDRLCLQPSFILSSKRNASNCEKVLFSLHFSFIVMNLWWDISYWNPPLCAVLGPFCLCNLCSWWHR